VANETILLRKTPRRRMKTVGKAAGERRMK
jgi:hypothetical protein